MLDDRDLPAMLPLIRSPRGAPLDECLGDPAQPLYFGPTALAVERRAAAALDAELGFVRHPAPVSTESA